MAATKALSSGDWAASYGFLAALPVWGLMPRKEEVRFRRRPPVSHVQPSPAVRRNSWKNYDCCLPQSLPWPCQQLLKSETGSLLVMVIASCLHLRSTSLSGTRWRLRPAGASCAEARCLHIPSKPLEKCQISRNV